jgi:hypothetical protein
MEMGGFMARLLYYLGKETPYQLNRRLGGQRSSVWTLWKVEKYTAIHENRTTVSRVFIPVAFFKEIYYTDSKYIVYKDKWHNCSCNEFE